MSIVRAQKRLAPQPPARSRGACGHEALASEGAGRDGVTLEDVVLGAWEDLVASGSAPCPVCRSGRLGPGEPCGECGSTLI